MSWISSIYDGTEYQEQLAINYSFICLCCIRINFNCSSNTSRCSSAVVRSLVSSVSGSSGPGLRLFFGGGGGDGLGVVLDEDGPTLLSCASHLSTSSSALLVPVAAAVRFL